MDTLKVLKIGGNVLADQKQLDQALDLFAAYDGKAILVHGGGRRASEILTSMGQTPKMINGRRITDAATLEVVTMVYAGSLNKQLVAKLQSRACNAIGLSGADGNLIRAHKRIVKDIDYGYAGDIEEVNSAGFQALLEAGFSPICCAITHDKQGQLLNTNADTIAASIATALADHYEVELQYCFEKPGVLLDAEQDDSAITTLTYDYYQQLISEEVVHSGMLPKLDNAFSALESGVVVVKIGNIDSLNKDSATHLIL